jgi:hypothetical protein
MSDELARALERRSLRAHQVVTATAAALLVVLAAHASPDREVIAAAGAAAVVTFAVALALACHEVRKRSVDAAAPASPRRVRVVARSLERLAGAAESGHRESPHTRPPRSVLELAPEAAAIRELATLLRTHGRPPVGAVAACDRFVDHSCNSELRGLDHETLRRELGRLRFAFAAESDQRDPARRHPSTALRAG